MLEAAALNLAILRSANEEAERDRARSDGCRDRSSARAIEIGRHADDQQQVVRPLNSRRSRCASS